MSKALNIWQYLKNDRKSSLAIRFLVVWIIIAILHPFIANDKALISKTNEGLVFPIFSSKTINQTTYDWKLMPLIPYSSTSLDLNNSNYKSPFSKQQTTGLRRHWFGTDKLGRDTLAGLLYGSFLALIIGFGASFFSVVLGVFIGLLAGYYRDDQLSFNLAQYLLGFVLLSIFIYSLSTGFFFGYKYDALYETLFLIDWLVLLITGIHYLGRLSMKKYNFKLDSIILRILEVFKSIPVLFFILSFLALITNAGIYSIIIIIALVSWPISCRYTRAEVISLREESFITSAKMLGLPDLKILLNHVLPNVISPALIVFSFGVSSAVVLEATLSFLGLGLSVDQVSWGSMLSEVRSNFKAWWLVLFPGIMLFLVVSSMNAISKRISQFLIRQD